MVKFEESCSNLTLTTTQLGSLGGTYASLIPFVVWREIILGKRWRNVFRRAVLETDMLVGVAGNIIEIPTLDRDEFTARTVSESNLDTYGYCKDRLSPSKVELTIGNVVYNATRISDILREDSPQLQWVRASLVKMGDSIEHYIDTAIRDALIAGVAAGNIQAAAVAGILDYDDIVDCKALMHNSSMWESEGGPFMMFVNPLQEADLLKDATFEHIERYEAGAIPFDPVKGLYAGCKVYATENMVQALALIVAPPTHEFGMAAVLAWKRHLKAESWRDEQYGRDIWLLSCRYGIAVVQDNAIGLITNC